MALLYIFLRINFDDHSKALYVHSSKPSSLHTSHTFYTSHPIHLLRQYTIHITIEKERNMVKDISGARFISKTNKNGHIYLHNGAGGISGKFWICLKMGCVVRRMGQRFKCATVSVLRRLRFGLWCFKSKAIVMRFGIKRHLFLYRTSFDDLCYYPFSSLSVFECYLYMCAWVTVWLRLFLWHT